jgi:DNA-binding transcriptional ArsR family regulator
MSAYSGDESDLEPDSVDHIFRALADPSRRELLDRLSARNGQNLRELCVGLDMARQSVAKHIAVLEGANLIVTVRRGRERLHFLNAAPVGEIADRWVRPFQERARALADLGAALESARRPSARNRAP